MFNRGDVRMVVFVVVVEWSICCDAVIVMYKNFERIASLNMHRLKGEWDKTMVPLYTETKNRTKAAAEKQDDYNQLWRPMVMVIFQMFISSPLATCDL